MHEFHAGPVPDEAELLTGELPEDVDDGAGYYDDVHSKKLGEEEVRRGKRVRLNWTGSSSRRFS